MTLASIQLANADKLDTLRSLDQFRDWQSLDEERYCLVCAKLITGREIQVIRSSPETGPAQAFCPTEHCNSIPMDWVLPATGGILAAISMRKADCRPSVAN